MAFRAHGDPRPLPWSPPHLTPRDTYMQDPSTSRWKIDISGTSHLPSLAHPCGRRLSAASPWPDNPWSYTDEERRQRVAEDVSLHELLIERRPSPPVDGEETLQERRERLLNSEEEVDAMQRKEAILEESYRRPVRRRRKGECEGEGSMDEAGEVAAGAWGGTGNGKIAAPKARVADGADEVNSSTESKEDGESTISLPDGPATTITQADLGVTDDSPYTEEVITAHEDTIKDCSATTLQSALDLTATLLMLIGLLGLYAMIST